jgi:hypothetical protein
MKLLQVFLDETRKKLEKASNSGHENTRQTHIDYLQDTRGALFLPHLQAHRQIPDIFRHKHFIITILRDFACCFFAQSDVYY